MTTNTTPTDLKEYPEVRRGGVPEHPAARPPAGKPKKRGMVWILLFLIVAGVAGYAVWRAGQTAAGQQAKGKGKGGGGGQSWR